MKGKHTPGPWEVVATSFEGCDNGEVAYWIVMPDAVASAANARLIAAAPELLEALQKVHAYGYGTSKDWEMVRAAIAKATGADE